ncbi:hypothetical protein MKD33_03960, partial [Chromobacterium piscinae]
AGVNLPIA